ncbi:MAG: 2-oxoacid:acceptor oxidoreductase family protein, partial [Armatimonadota bacterium]|nr:2-oxoacid:acceptor oxidoreductase family protein [Armatimonadota bacterium]
MVVNNLKLLVGGVQLRDGVTTITDILGKMFTRAGLHVLAMEKGYASTIYGAHQYDPVLVTDTPALSYGDDAPDILVALEHDTNPDVPVQPNRDTILRHGKNLKDGGVLLYDSSSGTVDTSELEARGVKVFPLPARQIALRELKREVVKNTVVTGALLRVLEFDMDYQLFGRYLDERFSKRGREIVDLNLEAARRGRAVIEEVLKAHGWDHVGYKLEARKTDKPMVLVNGNEALSMGAILAGCRFYAGYPITPASSILEFMEAYLPRYGGRALQGQNERESIRAAIGASMTGVRSAIGSSGPGISLKVEEFGVAGMTEVPVVVIDTQRAGPSTGMPTKPEQGDLALAVYAGHGEIPRIVLSAGTVEEC